MVFTYGEELKFATGSYTGNGATSLAVAIGFKPRYVKVWRRRTSTGSTSFTIETIPEIVDDNASGGAIETVEGNSPGSRFVTNAIISLDAGGFTVDDAGADLDLNKNAAVYNYMAIG